jgi:hypothetical protein
MMRFVARSGGGGIRTLVGPRGPKRFSRPFRRCEFAGRLRLVRQCVRQWAGLTAPQTQIVGRSQVRQQGDQRHAETINKGTNDTARREQATPAVQAGWRRSSGCLRPWSEAATREEVSGVRGLRSVKEARFLVPAHRALVLLLPLRGVLGGGTTPGSAIPPRCTSKGHCPYARLLARSLRRRSSASRLRRRPDRYPVGPGSLGAAPNAHRLRGGQAELAALPRDGGQPGRPGSAAALRRVMRPRRTGAQPRRGSRGRARVQGAALLRAPLRDLSA